jgi:hypothetical protein
MHALNLSEQNIAKTNHGFILVFRADHFGRQSDTGHGILKIVYDGAGHLTEELHPLFSDHLTDKPRIRCSKVLGYSAEKMKCRFPGACSEHVKKRFRGDPDQRRLANGTRSGTPSAPVNDSHLAEVSARFHPGQRLHLIVAGPFGQLDLARYHQINTIGFVVFIE